MGPETIEARAAELYGEVDWRQADGLLHVAAIHGSTNRILAIGPHSPPSPTDRFVLGLARARADVLITTGGILRAEPELVHRYSEQADEDDAIAAWRRQTVGRDEAPRLLVLSATGRFPKRHPALASGRGWIWTSAAGAREIGRAPAGFRIVTAEPDRASSTHAVAWLLEQLASEVTSPTVLLEAGPSTSGAFYASSGSPRVDELLLSRFEGALPAEAEGPLFVPPAEREALFGAARSTCDVDEASGRWIFERFLRPGA